MEISVLPVIQLNFPLDCNTHAQFGLAWAGLLEKEREREIRNQTWSLDQSINEQLAVVLLSPTCRSQANRVAPLALDITVICWNVSRSWTWMLFSETKEGNDTADTETTQFLKMLYTCTTSIWSRIQVPQMQATNEAMWQHIIWQWLLLHAPS